MSEHHHHTDDDKPFIHDGKPFKIFRLEHPKGTLYFTGVEFDNHEQARAAARAYAEGASGKVYVLEMRDLFEKVFFDRKYTLGHERYPEHDHETQQA